MVDYQKIAQDMDNALIDSEFEAAVKFISISNPSLGIALGGTAKLYKGDLQGVTSKATDLAGKKGLNKNIVTGAGFGQIFWSYQKTIAGLQKQYAGLNKKTMMQVMGAGISGTIGEDNYHTTTYVVQNGVYNPDIVYNIQKWQNDGLQSLVGEENINVESIYDTSVEKLDNSMFDNSKKIDEKVVEYMPILLNGKNNDKDINIYQMDMDGFIKCVEIIQQMGNINCIDYLCE